MKQTLMKKINSLFRTSLLLYIGVLLVQSSFAQQTGSFDRTINFNGNPGWVISYYVPPGYDAAKKYDLVIGLHGQGDTPQNYRDLMLNIGGYAGTPMYNAILICPYLEGANTDLWEPVGDTALVTKSIADAMSAYNIDPEHIYLNGFSLGGRAALRYGLLNYWRFRGLELWSPAIESMDEANNLTSFNYVWQNGKYIPITISVGSSDAFGIIVSTAYQHLSDAGALANLQIFYGLGHLNPQYISYYINSFEYIDSNATSYAMNDAGISNIVSPFEEVCGASFTPVVTIQNKGINNLTSAIINYQTDNGTVNTYNWSGNLIQLEKNKVTLPAQSISAGTHTFKAYTTMPNGVTDTVPDNDGITESFTSITRGVTSIAEGFEGGIFPESGWRQAGSDSAWSWQRLVDGNNNTSGAFAYYPTGKSGANGQSASCIYFDNAVPDNVGKNYSVRTPQFDFTNVNSPTLTYNYAYSPFRNMSVIYADTLAVYYSIDCGNTWNNLLKKGGLELSTTGTGVYDTTGVIFVPTSAQWKQETIDLNLNGLIGQPEVMFSFEDRSQWGNLLYLDNINIAAVTGIVNETRKATINIYPNPNNGQFTLSINARDNANLSIEISNILGEMIYSERLNGFSGAFTRQLDMKDHGSGIYFVSFKTPQSEVVKKVIVY